MLLLGIPFQSPRLQLLTGTCVVSSDYVAQRQPMFFNLGKNPLMSVITMPSKRDDHALVVIGMIR